MKNVFRPRFLLAIFVLISFLAVSVNAQEEKVVKEKVKQETSMNKSGSKYLVKFEHTPEQCLSDLEKIKDNNENMLNQIYWGCKNGDHAGYLMTEAKSEEAAIKGVPDGISTKVVKLDRFNKKQIEEAHKQMMKN